MKSPTPPILIVGAGPAGLTLALCLVQSGIPVRIIDKAPGPQVAQRGPATQPRALEIYNLLGVLPDILGKLGELQTYVFYEMPSGTKPLKTKCPVPNQPSPDIPYPNTVLIGQDRMEGVLRWHLENRFGTRVEFGTTLTSFEQSENSVAVHLVGTQQGAENEETLNFNWLIGADGAKSIVRKNSGMTFLGEARPHQPFIVGDLHILSGLDRDVSHRWGDFTRNGLGLRPTESLDDTLFQFIIGGLEVDHPKLLSDRQALLDYISTITGRTNLEFGEIIAMDEWIPNIRMTNTFSDRRVFIAGDAAHIHCTTGGQAVTSCLQDSLNLGWKLVLVERGLAPSSLLSTYNEERHPVIADMLKKTTAMFDRIMSDNWVNWPVKPLELRQLGVNYRWSSIIVDDAAGEATNVGPYGAGGLPIHAGDRAPEAPGLIDLKTGQTTSVFGIINCFQHTVLVLADSIADMAPFSKALEASPPGAFQQVLIFPAQASEAKSTGGGPSVGHILRDSEGHASSIYSGGTKPRVVVVRPDGIVGALSSNVGGLKRYLSLIF